MAQIHASRLCDRSHLRGCVDLSARLQGLPSIEELRGDETTRLSKVTAADGTPIGYFPPEGRIVMNGHNIPITLKQAIVSAEDATFYDHVGLEPRRILSALIADIKANSYVQGPPPSRSRWSGPTCSPAKRP